MTAVISLESMPPKRAGTILPLGNLDQNQERGAFRRFRPTLQSKSAPKTGPVVFLEDWVDSGHSVANRPGAGGIDLLEITMKLSDQVEGTSLSFVKTRRGRSSVCGG